ncbi:MAG TPA: putative sulfate exporter family transporter, partial [Acetobacteraceae bacterium]|nr:putative sulfate exporter family transporter [Acetobacteraceae bacterium]
WVARSGEAAGEARLAPPVFLFGFLALAALNSLGLVPAEVKAAITEISSFLIILAIGALGMKTSLLALARIGMAPVMLLVVETLFISALVAGLIYGLRGVGL